MTAAAAFAEKNKIFIFEDDEILGQTVKRYLEMKGFIVIHALNPEEGLEKIKTWVPDLIISDVNMPEIDGYGVLKQLQKTYKHIPVIILTGEHKLRKLFELEGATAFLQKPFDLDVLEQKIRAVLAEK